MVGAATVDNSQRVAAPPPPPVQPVRQLGPIEQGARLRHEGKMAQLQRDDFPAYRERLSQELDPADRTNPSAYDVPIKVKRQCRASISRA